MNILHVCGTKRLAGRELFVYKQSLKMRENGHNVFIVARTGFGLGELALEAKIPCLLYKGGISRLWFPFQVRNFITKNKIDVVHFHQLRLVRRLMPFLPGGNNRPAYIFTDAAPHPKKITSWLTTKVLEMLDLLLVPSESQRSQAAWALGYPEDKIKVLGNGVDTQLFCPPNDEDEKKSIRSKYDIPLEIPCISLMARIDKDKGQDTVIEAAKILVSEGRKFRVEICGDLDTAGKGQTFIDEIKIMSEDSLLNGCVHLRGFVSNVPEYLKTVDLQVLPSTYESFGFVIAEAMAVGLPVVATSVGALPYIIQPEECGIVVDHSSPKQLASAIARILDDPRMAAEMGRRGRERVIERFSLKRHLEEAFKYYDECR